MVRYADDATLIFENEEDLNRVMEVLPKRLLKYGLKMNERKTETLRFFPPRKGGRKPDTFNFLGFTHYWGKSRKGNWVIKRKTESERLTRALKAISQWCKKHRHLPIQVQHRKLNEKLRGHYNYYGITPNLRSLALYWENVKRIWMKWLNRRSRNPHLNWDKFNKLLLKYPLMKPKIYHSFI